MKKTDKVIMNYSSTTPHDATPLPPRLHWQQQSELPETPPLSEPPAGPVSFELVSHDDPKLLAEKEVEQFSNELLKKLDYAQLISTKTPQLSAPERELLNTITEGMSALRKNLVCRNFDLLALHQSGIWREHYESLADFAKLHAEISPSQLRKVLDETEVVEEFLRQGLYHVCPKGQNGQLLLKVTDPHRRVEAWEYARKECAADGLSRDRVRDALRDFCRENQITFGRRKESKKELERRTGNVSCAGFLQLPPKKASPQPPDSLLHVLSPSTLGLVESTYARKDPHLVVLEAIKNGFALESDPQNDNEIKTVMHWLNQNDPSTYRRVVGKALKVITEEIDRCVRERCKANAYEKDRLRRKQEAQTSSTRETC